MTQELAQVLSGTHLPTSEGWTAELGWQCNEIGRSVGMTSTGNRTQVARMCIYGSTVVYPLCYIFFVNGLLIHVSKNAIVSKDMILYLKFEMLKQPYIQKMLFYLIP